MCTTKNYKPPGYDGVIVNILKIGGGTRKLVANNTHWLKKSDREHK